MKYNPGKGDLLCFAGGFMVGMGIQLIIEGFRYGKLTNAVINEAENIARGTGEIGF